MSYIKILTSYSSRTRAGKVEITKNLGGEDVLYEKN